MKRGSVLLVAFGILLGGSGVWIAASIAKPVALSTYSLRIYEGSTTAVNGNGTAIGFQGSDVDAGFFIGGAMWHVGDDGSWHDAGDVPTCVTPLSKGQPLTLGVLHVPPTSEAPGSDQVIWLECRGLGIPYGG